MCKKNILVIGGGRWARVIIEVILEIHSESSQIWVYSPKNYKAMLQWTLENNFDSRVFIIRELLNANTKDILSVIIVNSARDHEKAIEWAIQNELPVLVEKPISLTANSTRRLISLATEKKTQLSAAHVFRFARYLTNFSILLKKRDIKSIYITWIDPQSESRYGEQKKYDPSLPIFKDLFPHIISILSTLELTLPNKIESLKVYKGGSDLEIKLYSGKQPCLIRLARNGEARQRVIKVETQSIPLILDFSKEPGFIFDGKSETIADPDWNSKMRPLATMLTAFLDSIHNRMPDDRLDSQLGLKANELIDMTTKLYNKSRYVWLLKSIFFFPNSRKKEIMYAISEILQSNPFIGRYIKI